MSSPQTPLIARVLTMRVQNSCQQRRYIILTASIPPQTTTLGPRARIHARCVGCGALWPEGPTAHAARQGFLISQAFRLSTVITREPTSGLEPLTSSHYE